MKNVFESSQIFDDFREDLANKVERLEIADYGDRSGLAPKFQRLRRISPRHRGQLAELLTPCTPTRLRVFRPETWVTPVRRHG